MENKNFKFKIKNVRCFAEEQNLEIRPITFLVGENSTGKTSILGCFSTIYEFISDRWFLSNFNKDPYLMGSFSDIVNKNSKSDSFELGIILEEKGVEYNFCFGERSEGAEPTVKKINIHINGSTFSCMRDGKKYIYSIDGKSFTIDKGDNDIPLEILMISPYRMMKSIVGSKKEKGDEKMKAAMKVFETMEGYKYKHFAEEIFNLPPVRSKPQRTYNPVDEHSSEADGGSIPGFLMRRSVEKKKEWREFEKKMSDFGKASGLFDAIEVKKFGNVGEPFQLKFEIRKNTSNIIDTGYGVSQILPLLTRLFSSKPRRVNFLLQQPEVHLHPKAQAALAPLLVESVKEGNSFLIETHSDYIIDRTRVEIRKKNISPEQVSLIYLEPSENQVKAHNIHFDEQGNVCGAPGGYRDFFIKESDMVLGFDD